MIGPLGWGLAATGAALLLGGKKKNADKQAGKAADAAVTPAPTAVIPPDAVKGSTHPDAATELVPPTPQVVAPPVATPDLAPPEKVTRATPTVLQETAAAPTTAAQASAKILMESSLGNPVIF